ncbi:MAG: fused MFS/spermidine synthase [Polyangiaceae bacterium]
MTAPEGRRNEADCDCREHVDSLRLVSCTLLGAAVLGGLLVSLDVIHVSVFRSAFMPRTECLVAGLAGVVGSIVLGRFATKAEPSRDAMMMVLLPLCALALRLLEAISLLLDPVPLDAAFLGAMARPLPTVVAGTMAMNGATVLVTAALSAASILVYLGYRRSARGAFPLNQWLVAQIVATVLLFAFPIEGPYSLDVPLPPNSSSDVTVEYLPRLGALSLPCLTAFLLLFWSVRRSGRTATDLAAAALSFAVVFIELGLGRYSPFAVVTAAVVAFAAVKLLPEPVNDRGPLGDNDTEWRRLPSSTQRPSASLTSTRTLLTAVFFLSGMAALVYQVVYAKGLALTFGSTSHASTIVLATYMAGLSLGSWLGGKWAERLELPVIGYAFSELGIAALCAASPWTLRIARQLYVHIAEGANPSDGWLVGLQLAFGALVLVPPTMLMGLTMPLLTREFLDDRTTLGASAGLLYTANTLGAAVGGCVTGYAVLPSLGVTRSLYAAVAVNVLVAIFALIAARLGRTSRPSTANVTTTDQPKPAGTQQRRTKDVSPTAEAVRSDHLGLPNRATRLLGIIAIIQLTIGGFVTFGLETTFVHLLATVAGTSAYAFSLMLFAFLIGLSGGATLGRHWLPKPARLATALLLCQLVLAMTLLLGSAYWDMLPGYFASFGRWPFASTFAAREFVRFVVCLVVMLPPAVCIGAQFPIAMEAIGLGFPARRIRALGSASALNTVGNILGAIVVGFVLLPRLGSHRTLATLTLLCILLSALALVALHRAHRPLFSGLVVAVGVALYLSPPSFDLTRLSSGGNVYFKPQYYGRVIDAAESLDGGLTTVALSHADSATPVKTLLTNGKFQGNDRRDTSGEMMAQTSFAIAPLLHTSARQRALVIGFGTGTTTRVLDEAGFRHVDVAELSGDIVNLADKHFATINQHVVHRPNVHVHVTDGRNFLLLGRQRYDLVSIELSSIWFAGAANLYNDEFYALLEPRLSEHGVLQQWVQLHRLNHRDILTILVTLKRRFPKTWLYFLGKQGIIVACKHDCSPNTAAIERLLGEKRLEKSLAVFPNGLRSVLYGRLLTPEGLEAVINDYVRSTGTAEAELISTDDNLYLEYSTPKGNVRDYDESIFDNERFLARRRPLSPYESTHLSLADVPSGASPSFFDP